MLKPMRNWILTKVLEEEKVCAGGIIIPNSVKNKTKFVKIIAFGEDSNPNDQLKVGDIVMVPAHTGLKVNHEDKEFEFAKAENFFGVVEEGGE